MKQFMLVLSAALALGACTEAKPLHVATGYAAHVLCSETFASGQDPAVVFRDFIGRTPGLTHLKEVLVYRVDRARREVRTLLLGGFESVAAYSDGRGCTIIHGDRHPAPIDLGPNPTFAPDPLAAPPNIVTASDPVIEAALARAAEEPAQGPYLGVKAIVVVHHGRIIAERYAPGFGPDTRMLSWSTAKSIINALTGVLVRKGELNVDGPAPVAAWSNPADPRHAVSIDTLLRQTSGQPFGSSNSGFDRSTRMQFEEPDTARYAEAAQFDSPPGKTWSYTDANYAILSGIIRDHVGGTAQSVARFAHDELFGPLGMKSATFEYDEAGNPMGGTYYLSTARDWARFGLLYLHGGMIGDRRVLPEGWVEYSARPTPQAAPFGYGAGFWTNRGPDDYAQGRRRMGEPADSFYANGNYAQTVLIAPQEDLIVARFSMGEDTDGRVSTQHVAHMVGEILAELKKTEG